VNEPVRLPRAHEAVIPTPKLVNYALDLTHERGQHKARVFASALGISAGDWRYLHDQILAALPTAEVRGTRDHSVRRRVRGRGDNRRAQRQDAAGRDDVDGRARSATASDISLGRHPLIDCDNPLAMATKQHQVLDVVELAVESGRWPAGTVGTVVEADDHQALVEISDDRGHGLDFVALPHDALRRPSLPRPADRAHTSRALG
jgi:hypothetical protein